MQYFKVTVMLSGDRNHVVTNKGPVSVPEIAILKSIHGNDAVMDIRGCEAPLIGEEPHLATHAEIRETLQSIYQNALPAGNDPIVDKLFGPMGKLPTTLAHIGIDHKSEAAKLRASAAAAMAAADALETQPDPLPLDDEDEADFAEFIAEPKKTKAA